jgi:hypothetical protein
VKMAGPSLRPGARVCTEQGDDTRGPLERQCHLLITSEWTQKLHVPLSLFPRTEQEGNAMPGGHWEVGDLLWPLGLQRPGIVLWGLGKTCGQLVS